MSFTRKSDGQKPAGQRPRRPQAFTPDNPALAAALKAEAEAERLAREHAERERQERQRAQAEAGDARTGRASARSSSQSTGQSAGQPAGQGATYRPRHLGRRQGISWGSIFVSALSALIMLGLTAWAMRFVTETLQGNDWIAWTAFGLISIAAIAFLALALREIAGIMRLRQLRNFRHDVERALSLKDRKAELKCIRRLKALYRDRSDMHWALANFREHEQQIVDAGDLLTLAERDLLLPLDNEARFLITASAKRVSLVTAISPIAIIDVLFVLSQNLKLLRQIATLYGARPGFLGSLRLAKLVATHIIATGGLALTDDLIGQILGHDIVRRLSQRIGEGVFNGALTARIGIAAIEILRPLPYIEVRPVRLRDLVPVIFKGGEKSENDKQDERSSKGRQGEPKEAQ